MDNEPEDELDGDDLTGDFLSNSDQMLAQMAEIARVSAAYCQMLLDAGIPEVAAHRMTVDWHQSYWVGAHAAAMDVFDDEMYGSHEDDDDDAG